RSSWRARRGRPARAGDRLHRSASRCLPRFRPGRPRRSARSTGPGAPARNGGAQADDAPRPRAGHPARVARPVAAALLRDRRPREGARHFRTGRGPQRPATSGSATGGRRRGAVAVPGRVLARRTGELPVPARPAAQAPAHARADGIAAVRLAAAGCCRHARGLRTILPSRPGDVPPARERERRGTEVARQRVEGSRLCAHRRYGGISMLALLIAAAVAQPGRDPTLLHRDAGAVVAAKEQEQEAALRRMLELGGSPAEQAEALARLAGLLRSRGLAASIRAQAEADEGNEAAAARDRRAAGDARAESIARYRELLNKYPRAPRTDEALFFLADSLQESGRDREAIVVAGELSRRFRGSSW